MRWLLFALALVTGCSKDERLKSMDAWRQGAPAGMESRPPYIDFALGERLYKDHCLACHGAGGAGDGLAGLGLKARPADLRAEAASSSAEDIYMDIAQGKTGTAMSAWSGILKEDEVIALVGKVKRFKARP